MDSDVREGALIDAAFERAYTHVRAAFAAIGIEDALLQDILIVAIVGALLWVFVRHVSQLGYRVNSRVGVAVQILTLGPLLTFLFVTLRAWVAFRQPSIARALASLFGS